MGEAERRIHGAWHIDYEYSVGRMAIRFFDNLEEGRLVGSRCSSCVRVCVPPKGFCEHCFVALDEIVPVGETGTIEAVTVVTAPFEGSPEVPYCVAYVKLDGATTAIANFVKGVPLGLDGSLPDQIRVGAAVRVVFADERTGRITDFWFEPAA